MVSLSQKKIRSESTKNCWAKTSGITTALTALRIIWNARLTNFWIKSRSSRKKAVPYSNEVRNLIYADNAATTQMDSEAYEIMQEYLKAEYANPSSLYSFAREGKKALSKARRTIAECINALPEEIYFTSGGSESDNWAVKGTALYGGEKRCVITSQIEHHAVIRACEQLEYLGFPVVYLSSEKDGTILPETLEKMIFSPRLVSIMLANNEIGTIQPVRELADIAHLHGAYFHTDAVQAVGHIPIDVRQLGVDMLSASGHKFGAPKGVGFLYIRNGVKILPLINGGSQENGIRGGTENVAAIAAMAAALKNCIASMNKTTTFLNELTEHFFALLDNSNISYSINGNIVNRLPGHISISFWEKSGEALLHQLDLKGICVSTGSACDSVRTETSHVLQAINLSEKLANGTIRITFGKNNTINDTEAIATALISSLKK